MAFPIIYFDTGGSALGSGSSDAAAPTHSSTINGVTVSVSGTTVTFSAPLDLSAVPTDGSATIFINDATNTNWKIFKITSVNDGADTLVVDTAPTGTITVSTWGIGGQRIYASADHEGAQAPGWIFQFNNSPASKTTDFITQRVAGTAAAGLVTYRGKAGTRPVLNVTNTTQCIQGAANIHYWSISNLEFDQDGASGNVVDAINGANTEITNIKVSDGGGIAINFTNNCVLSFSELTGVLGDGLNMSANANSFGNYIHDVGGDGIESTSTTPGLRVIASIIDTAAGRGIYCSGAIAANTVIGSVINGNSIYLCGDSGFEVADTDFSLSVFSNNIFQDNGNAAGEFNIEVLSSFWPHSYNLYYHQGGGGGANLSGLTANTTELTSDPLFVDAPNGDFRLNSTSPAKATGFPGQFLGGPLGYLDMGAVQRQEAGGASAYTFS